MKSKIKFIVIGHNVENMEFSKVLLETQNGIIRQI